jgi:hypothetical protein
VDDVAAAGEEEARASGWSRQMYRKSSKLATSAVKIITPATMYAMRRASLRLLVW